MYTWFYGFKEEPFNITPDPKFLFLTPAYQEVLESLVKGIQGKKRFFLILGKLGVGKTTLIHYLLDILNQDVKAVAIFQPPSSFEELIEKILGELGISSIAQNRASMIRQFHTFLESLGEEKTLMVMIDEAQDLSREVMEELYLFSEQERGISRKLQILLTGQPELQASLDSERLRDLKQGIELRREIRLLNEEECRQYIDHRLKMVESDMSKVITPEAVSLICQYAKGNPRTINILCDNAFLIGYGLSQKKVNSDIVTEVLEDLDFLYPEEGREDPMEKGRKFRASRRKRGDSLFRKLGYSLMALGSVGVVILLGRMYLKDSLEKPTSRFPILQPMVKEEVSPPASETKPDLSARVVSKVPEGEGKKAALEPKPAPSPGQERRAVVAPPGLALPVSRAHARVGKTVTVQTGDSIYTLAEKNYKVANTSIVDLILESNPKIANPNKLFINQEIRLPEITEDSLVIKTPDGTYKILLGTFLKAEYASFLKGLPPLKGKEMEIVPRKLPWGETWYRASTGGLKTREEGLKVIDGLKKRGLSPYFPGFGEKKG